MGIGRGAVPSILKFSAKKVVSLVLSGKKQILPLLGPRWKTWKNEKILKNIPLPSRKNL